MIRKNKTTQQFVEEALAKHCGRYSYEEVEYIKNNSKVKIKCAVHGHFMQSPVKHLAGQGCPICSKDLAASRYSCSLSDFIEKARKVHGDVYDYSKVIYKNAKTKILVGCKDHGEFSVTPDCHLVNGCPECGREKASVSMLSNTNDFVEKAAQVHGQSYNYDKVTYLRHNTLVTISCTEHGDFLQTPQNHLSGRGCKACALCGYNPDKSGSLYILKNENILKVGITNRQVNKRVAEINKASGKGFFVVAEYNFQSGYTAKNLESVLLCYLRNIYQQPDEKFSGYTECFTDVVEDDFNEFLNSMIGDLACEH